MLTALTLLLLAAHAGAGDGDRIPNPGAGTVIQVSAGNKLAFRAYAEGDQVYRSRSARSESRTCRNR